MFSGIVEATSKIIQVHQKNQSVQIIVERPKIFDDLKNGDSVATNGVCLTVESFNVKTIQFSLGFETIKVLKLNPNKLKGQKLNLERSLRFGDRIHGHLVSGHVDSLGQVVSTQKLGDNLILKVQIEKHLKPYVWKKGSITLHGVSLTINDLTQNKKSDSIVEVCLIPETLKRTNLEDLRSGDFINIEPDYFAKALFNFAQTSGALKKPQKAVTRKVKSK